MLAGLQCVLVALAFLRGWGARAVAVGVFAWSFSLLAYISTKFAIHSFGPQHPELEFGLNVALLLSLSVMVWRRPKRISPGLGRFVEWAWTAANGHAANLYADAARLRDKGRFEEAILVLSKSRSYLGWL